MMGRPLEELIRRVLEQEYPFAAADLRIDLAEYLGVDSERVRVFQSIPADQTAHGHDVDLRIEILKQ